MPMIATPPECASAPEVDHAPAPASRFSAAVPTPTTSSSVASSRPSGAVEAVVGVAERRARCPGGCAARGASALPAAIAAAAWQHAPVGADLGGEQRDVPVQPRPDDLHLKRGVEQHRIEQPRASVGSGETLLRASTAAAMTPRRARPCRRPRRFPGRAGRGRAGRGRRPRRSSGRARDRRARGRGVRRGRPATHAAAQLGRERGSAGGSPRPSRSSPRARPATTCGLAATRTAVPSASSTVTPWSSRMSRSPATSSAGLAPQRRPRPSAPSRRRTEARDGRPRGGRRGSGRGRGWRRRSAVEARRRQVRSMPGRGGRAAAPAARRGRADHHLGLALAAPSQLLVQQPAAGVDRDQRDPAAARTGARPPARPCRSCATDPS